MRKKSGFTLIELLVVIAIIALLMSILMPSLTKVKKQARAVICTMNLKQWGLMIQVYASENNGSMHGVHVGDTAWQNAYRPIYENQPKIRCCPEATKPQSKGARGPFAAWGIFGDGDYGIPYNFKAGDYGSYGENNWDQNPVAKDGTWEGNQFPDYYWKTPYVKEASNVPVFLECGWMHGVFGTFRAGAPPYELVDDSGACGGLYLCMLNRHSGYAGSSFLDGSARKVGLKRFLKLKWHTKYDTNRWFREQEVLGWPGWLKNFKDE